jgi:regulator of sirC expression with transglutaminase-like and TPR domain
MAITAWAENTLRRIGAQGESADAPLAEGALALAHRARPSLDPEPYRAHLADLIRETREAHYGGADTVVARRDALHTALVARAGYAGDEDTYDDLDNANLMRVIDRRRGLPVALGILYIATAQGLGWQLEGLAFPGHFLMRLEHAGERRILDPFHGLRALQAAELRALIKRVAGDEVELRAEHYAPVPPRDLLLRLENNRKLRLMAEGMHAEALEALEAMLMLAPHLSALWREAGVLHAQVGNLRGAVIALEHARDLGQDPAERQAADDLLRQLRPRLH